MGKISPTMQRVAQAIREHEAPFQGADYERVNHIDQVAGAIAQAFWPLDRETRIKFIEMATQP